jgi:acetylornithine deacetylase/succinyl-diaminopimelate desuccinylase-like protein
MDRERLDRDYLVATLATLARVPTDVPVGETELAPDHPKITRYVHEALQPAFGGLGLKLRVLDEWNNALVTVGPSDQPPALLLMLYTTSQHGHETDPADEGRVADGTGYGVPGLCVYGRGTGQGKGATAAVLAALRMFGGESARFRRPVAIAVNTEGRSSHSCSKRLIDEHGVRAESGILCIGTGNEVVLGNRGRVDVRVTVRGRSAHSSSPHLGLNAIEGANEVLNRLRRLVLPNEHPYLGREQVTVYKLVCSPIAPHTLPDTCELTLDRRLLPGTEIDEAVEGIRSALADLAPFEVSVEPGMWMLPADVSRDAPIVAVLRQAYSAATQEDAALSYAPYTFDAGYPCARGIPTVMFGPSRPGRTRGLGRDVTAPEFVPVAAVESAALTYAGTILRMCGMDEADETRLRQGYGGR